jgi:protocatechuate 3,4-dioxygenase beta subunit
MRHIPEAGAVCGNTARTDLRGGQGVTSVPTATEFRSDKAAR